MSTRTPTFLHFGALALLAGSLLACAVDSSPASDTSFVSEASAEILSLDDASFELQVKRSLSYPFVPDFQTYSLTVYAANEAPQPPEAKEAELVVSALAYGFDASPDKPIELCVKPSLLFKPTTDRFKLGLRTGGEQYDVRFVDVAHPSGNGSIRWFDSVVLHGDELVVRYSDPSVDGGAPQEMTVDLEPQPDGRYVEMVAVPWEDDEPLAISPHQELGRDHSYEFSKKCGETK